MNRQDQIDRLLQKLTENSLSRAEFDKLMAIIDDPDTTTAINTKLEDLWGRQKNTERSDDDRPDYRSDLLYFKILDKIEHIDHIERSKKRRLTVPYRKWSRMAAMLIVMVGLSFIFIYEGRFPVPKPTVFPETNLKSDAITLQMDNGSIEIISVEGEQTIIDQQGMVVGSQKGASLTYLGNDLGKDLVYNTLSIPHGKRFDLLLSDGTKVILNSGSSIKYPIQFIPGNTRKVFLRGEAYFDVAEDKAHPFIVKANDLEVQVLGTQFNLSHYPEDTEITTVLVEGSVELYKDGADRNTNTVTQLRPGQKAAWRGVENKMSVKQVDTEIYTAWKEGFLLFKAAPFSKIKTTLERHFNITIENNDQYLADQVYTATFREETIEEILEAFKEDISFSYTRLDNKIIITNSITN